MLEELAEAVGRLFDIDPDGLADKELSAALVGLARERARLEAAEARLTAAWDQRRAWAADGARRGADWLAWRCRVPKPEAERQVRRGRWVGGAPGVERAWREGSIGTPQVDALARSCTGRSGEALRRDEDVLVGAAQELAYSDFAKTVGYWAQQADADGAEAGSDRQVERRRAHLAQGIDGMWLGSLRLDPLRGAAVAETLRLIEQELFQADWAEARRRSGEGARLGDVLRTPAQRRADTFVEMAVRARTAPADGRRPAPLFTVLVGYETFAGRVCELANGTPVSPGSVARWLDGADIERVVFGAPSRVMDVGAHTRFFTGADRRAIEVRDRTCYHPTCEETENLQADHVQPWSEGGATTVDNGRLACPFHNRLRNQRPAGGEAPAARGEAPEPGGGGGPPP